MIFTIGLANTLSDLPISFFMKEKLRLDAEGMARFSALVSIPSYLGFLVGFLRDRWRPLKKGDAGYFIVTLPVLALIYVVMARMHVTYSTLMWTSIAYAMVSNLLTSAVIALEIAAAQRYGYSGRITALSAVIGSLPSIVSNILGGSLVNKVPLATVFYVCALLLIVALGISFLRPKLLFRESERRSRADKETIIQAIKRMFQHRELWPSYIIIFLFVFAPGWGTPLFYYLTDTVHLKPDEYGATRSVTGICTLLVGISYGWLCQRVPLKKLLYSGTILAVISGVTTQVPSR
jgi:MFS family permease